jgi:DNA transposition AAA+ family ATPase
LLIVDEAERLNVTALEWLHHLNDRASIGLILTSMPGAAAE